MYSSSKIWLYLILLVASPSLLLAQGSHPFSVYDMVSAKRISGHQVSPDGRWIVFVLRTTDLEGNRGTTDLWLVRSDGQEMRQLTTHPAGDSSPQWAPDGQSIIFLSTRSGSSQIWDIRLSGGEARQISHLPLDVHNLKISPDGRFLAFSLEVFPDCAELECTVQRLQAASSSPETGRVFDQLFVRHWDAWKDGRRSHLFVMPVDGRDPIDVMRGMEADTPSKPFGGTEEFTFTPDGAGLVFTAKLAGSGEAWSTNFDLYLVGLGGKQPARNLTRGNQAWDTQPVFSPDGNTLAYLAMGRPGFEADQFEVVLMEWPEGSSRTLTGDWDRSPAEISWSKDGKLLFLTADNLGNHSLFSIHVDTGAVRSLVEEGTIGSPKQALDRVYFSLDNLQAPAEIFSSRLDGSDLKSITKVNGEHFAQVRMGEYEQFSFKGWNNETVYGWVVKPADFNETLKYPVAFLIHGGPQGSFGNHFHYRWNPQAYAGAGYAAVMIDFHGSTGYGQEFTDSISGDWGGKPLEDLQDGLTEVLRLYPWMDSERVGALGASYGGYMINWIAGNWPDQFRCLVNHDGTFDNRMMYYATEELWFPEWEHGGPYWESKQGHERHNPANFVENWKTPMLVIHGALDFRIPVEQGLAAFTALQRRSIPSRFLYFPDENHWVLKPQNSIQWHSEVIGWLDKWLK